MKQSLDNQFAINHKNDENGDIVILLSFSTFIGPQYCIVIVININLSYQFGISSRFVEIDIFKSTSLKIHEFGAEHNKFGYFDWHLNIIVYNLSKLAKQKSCILRFNVMSQEQISICDFLE